MIGIRVAVLALGLLLATDPSLVDCAPPKSTNETLPNANKPLRIATVDVQVILQEFAKADLLELQAEADRRQRQGEKEAFREAFRVVRPDPNPFLQREAAIYSAAYAKVQQEVAAYCKIKGIDLVLNDPCPIKQVNLASPDDLLREISKLVVVSEDISPAILARIRSRRAGNKP